MELIDWSKVFTAVVTGVVIVFSTWLLIVLGAILFRIGIRPFRLKKNDAVPKHLRHLAPDARPRAPDDGR